MLSAFVAQSNNAVDAEADERNAHRTMKSGILVGVLGVGLLGCGGRSELELRGGEVPDISGAAGGSATLGPPACAPHAPGTLLWSTIPDPGFCSSGHAVLRGDAQGDARVEISESDQQIENAGPSPKDGLRVSLTKLDAGGAQQWNVAVGRVPYTGSGHSALATDRNDTARVLTPRPIDPTGLQPVLSTVSDAGVRTAAPLTKNPEGRWWPVAMQTDVALATVLLGVANNSVDVGGGLLAAQDGEFFVAKLDNSNQHQWSRVFGGPVTQVDLDVESAGSMTLAGLLRGNVTFGDMSFSSAGVGVFVASLESDGHAIFSHLLKSTNTPALLGVARDAARHSYVAVGFQENLDLGDRVLTDSGAILLKYDVAGQVLWIKSLGQPTSFSLALSAHGEPLLAATASRGIDLGDGVVSNDASLVVAKLDPDGALIWAKHMPGGTAFAPSVAPGTCDSVLLAGTFKGIFGTGNQQLASKQSAACPCVALEYPYTDGLCWSPLVLSFAN